MWLIYNENEIGSICYPWGSTEDIAVFLDKSWENVHDINSSIIQIGLYCT